MAVIRSMELDLKRTFPVTVDRASNAKVNREEALSETTVLTSYPRRIFLEMTSACNINCKMCGRNAADFCPTILKKEWLSYLEPITDKVEELTLMGWGEPTIHPDFSYFLKWGHKYGLRIYFCTNGTMLGKLKKDIFRYHVDIITVSLDGADAATNNSIRKGTSFDEITEHIKNISAEKKVRGIDYPYLSIVITLMKSNFRQFPDYVRLAHDLGVTEVKGVFLTVFEKRLLNESLVDKMDELKVIFDEAAAIGDELGVDVKLPYIMGEDPAGDSFHKKCYMAWRDFYVGSDGYVRPCMHTSRKLFRVDKYEGFAAMWNSPEYQKFRENVNKENMDHSCRNCYHATYGNWNKTGCHLQIGNDFSPTWEN